MHSFSEEGPTERTVLSVLVLIAGGGWEMVESELPHFWQNLSFVFSLLPHCGQKEADGLIAGELMVLPPTIVEMR